MRRPDLGIGARLTLAFGAVALLLAVLAVAALRLLAAIEGRTTEYATMVLPRFEAAERLESEVLYLGIAVRSYILAPTDAGLRAYRARVSQVRAAVVEASMVPDDEEGSLVFAPVPALTEAYVRHCDALVEAARARRGVLEADVELARVREELLGPMRRFTELEKGKAAAMMGEVAGAHRETRRVLVAVSLAIAAVLAATALLTWRAVRVPVLALAETTRRVAAGDWAAGAALAGAPGDVRPRRNELVELSRAFGRMAIELQRREERLAAQNEELQAQNEEIQAQSEEIQSQSEEIQAQADQLQAGNDELMAQGNELRRVNEALARSERRYRLLFEHVSEGFSLHEVVYGERGEAVDHRVLEVNPAFERLTGLSRERVLGRTAREILGVEPFWLDRCARVAATGEPARFEGGAPHFGKTFEVIVFRPAPGQFATVFFDVTDRKEAEEALRAADRRKDEFLAVLSHELRNPLAPIRNALHLLERGGGDAERLRRAREVIARQVSHLTRIVEDLLDVTRISRGKVELQRTRVDLARVVREAAQDAASMLDEAGVRLDVEIAAAPLFVDGDPARLSQVLGNLLHNAAKFTPAGGRVALLLEADGGRSARVRIRDTGTGIAPQVLERMFEPFVQEERSLARTRGGLGLGLSLVKGFVELHGGTVRAWSDGPERGAEFTVELPLDGSAPGAAEAAASPRQPRRRILLVEDNVDGAETLRDVLELVGHEVEVAVDGTSGVAKARERPPDAVLCDVGLPDIDGYEVARRIRAEPALAGVVLVALTGYALPDDRRRAEEAGFDAHLAKPATIEEIEALLSRVDRRGAQPPPA